MKKKTITRSTAIIFLESFLWIILTYFVRYRLDLAATGWQITEPWLFLLKIGVVLALISIALGLHGLLFRWLARRGIIPDERKD
jgi:hypothetical protein